MYIRKKLQDIIVTQDGKIIVEIDKKKYRVDDNFKKSFCRMFNLSSNGSMSKMFTFKDLFNSVKPKYKEKPVTLFLDNKVIRSIFASEIYHMTPERGEMLISKLIRKVIIEDLEQTAYGLSFTIISKHKVRDFNLGIRVEIPYDGRPSGHIYLACQKDGYRAIIKKHDVSSKLDMRKLTQDNCIDKILKTIRYILASPDVLLGWLDFRIDNIEGTDASFQEIVECAAKLRRETDNQEYINDLGIDKIMDELSLASINDRSYQWRKTVRTSMTKMQLLEFVSSIATKDRNIPLQEYAGDIIGRQGDMEDIADNVNVFEEMNNA